MKKIILQVLNNLSDENLQGFMNMVQGNNQMLATPGGIGLPQ